MPETANSEFWKDIAPVPNAMRDGGLPELYLPDIASGDPAYWMPLSDTVFSKPVWICLTRNMWADVLMATTPGLVNRHYHPHPVWAYTISGKWAYLEHDWTATAGDFIYEPPGESHTLVSYEHADPMKVFFVVSGPLMWLDEAGETVGHFDAYDYLAAAREHYDSVGIGASYLDKLIR